MPLVTIELKTKAATFLLDVHVSGNVESGGSNRYGSDEPRWTETTIESVMYEGRELSDKAKKAVTPKSWRCMEANIPENY